MSAGPGVEINFPAPPPYETHATTVQPTSGEDTETKTLSPEQIAARDVQRKNTADAIAFTDQERAQQTKAAEIEKQNADLALFATDAAEQLRTGPQAQKAQEYVTWARQHTKDQEDRLAKMPAPALFADRDGWGKVRLGVGMALAGLGDGMMAAAMIRAGHAPSGRSTVSEIIERDLARQRAAIDKQKDNVLIARTGIADAEEARRAVMADIDLKGKHMFKQAEALTRQRLAALKIDQATIDQTKEVLDLKTKAANAEAQYVAGHDVTVKKRWDSAKTTNETINRTPTTTGGGGVEADTKAAQFALFKDHATKVANALPGLSPNEVGQINRVMSSESFLEGKGTVDSVLQSLGGDAETASTPRVKEYLENVRRGAAALGRMDSGAAIGTVENIRFQRSLMPKNSDKKPDLDMRAENILGDVKIRGDYFGKPAKYAAPTGGAPATSTPAPEKKEVPFTPAGVARMKAISGDANRSRKDRDNARAYISEAAKAGVR